jgi:hypothetical protein
MIAGALDAGVSARWVAADEVYGADPGGCAPISKPARWDMCWPSAAIAACPPQPARYGPTHPERRIGIPLWLLIRRHPRHGELAFYRCYWPTLVRLGELVRVAGRRWTIEESFQAAKGLAGLDEHQVRRWLAWRCWTLLAMLAHALLAVIAATERAHHPPQPGLIALTCNEIRPPVHQLDHRTHPPAHRSAGLVTMATSPSIPCPRQPLPPPTSPAHVITIYGWSVRWVLCTGVSVFRLG